MKKIIAAIAAAVLISSTCMLQITPVLAAVPYESYTYNFWGESTAAPQACVPTEVLDGISLGVGSFKDPTDMFVSEDGDVYIADTGNNRILKFNSEWKLQAEIKDFEHGGKKDTFNTPEGIFVAHTGEIYVADTGNSRIVKVDREGKFLGILEKPKSDLLPADQKYSPYRLVVDKSKRLYVVAKGINQGIIELSSTGNLEKFIGAPKVYVNPVDYFWKSIATKEQKAHMVSYVPTEYNSVFIDDEGFIYATISALKEEQVTQAVLNRDRSSNIAPVKKLTLSGDDVLKRMGFFPPVGDIEYNKKGYNSGPSSLIDICTDQDGNYSVLDVKRGRVFTYDFDGNLLYVFGGIGNQVGTFSSATALCKKNGQYLVLDKTMKRITVFEKTEYGKTLTNAIQLYMNGNYEEAQKVWSEVLRLNANADLAYFGMGKIYMRQNDYQSAMKNFKLANRRDYYSKALKLYRKEVIGKYVGIIVFVVIITVFAIVGLISTYKAVQRVRNFGKTAGGGRY